LKSLHVARLEVGKVKSPTLKNRGLGTRRCLKVYVRATRPATFVKELGKVRDEMGFHLLGYVVMPEHGHLLLVTADVEEREEKATPRPRFKRRTWGTLCVVLVCELAKVSSFDREAV